MQNPGGVLLIRHGQSEWNEQGKWQGLADPPLSDQGRRQARLVAEHLRDIEVSKVFSSDLQRAFETAQIISEELGIAEVIPYTGLRERDAGDWTGLTNKEIEDRWPEVAELRAAGKLVKPTGANNPNFEERALATLRELLNEASSGVVLAFTHGGFIRGVERSLHDPSTNRIANLSGRWIFAKETGLALGESFTVNELSKTGIATDDSAEDPQRI